MPKNLKVPRPFQGQDEEGQKAWQGHFVAATGEFVGTFMFLWFAFAGTQVAGITTAGNGTASAVKPTIEIFFICLVFGLSLLSTVWVFYRISGGLFNPAVSIPTCPNVHETRF